jgi:hypothetical protein
MKTSSVCFALLAVCGLFAAVASAADDKNDSTFAIGEGRYTLPVPAGWERKPPKTKIVEHEFAVPAAEGDEMPGRVTVMAAGGSVEDNINRWCGQFTQPDGSDTKDKAKVKTSTIAGAEVRTVDLSGTYNDAPPFAGRGIQRENYRMLAAIISTKDAGNYFIKLYGPSKTISGQEAAFAKMVEGLQAKGK